ncbi:MAG: LUD domain-containing protein [Cyclobacteriaceae bacterium]|nr:LUD domain-containing protein [Cyclobacteriaceae bacterium]
MSSREKILGDIKKNKPPLAPLPQWTWDSPVMDAAQNFIIAIKNVSGKVVEISNIAEARENILNTHGEQQRIVDRISSITSQDIESEDALSLEKIEVGIIEGQVGVAENGAIWVDQANTGHRALPFICQHLCIVLETSRIVPTMHEAYSLINVKKEGFGTFIAGPSKTADIEQALVIGAHGPRSLTVFLLKN